MISGPGRPLRFLGVLLAGWVGVRVAMLWPAAQAVPGFVTAVPPVPAAVEARARAVLALPFVTRLPQPLPATWVLPPPPSGASPPPIRRHDDPGRLALALLGFAQFGPPEDAPPPAPSLIAGLPRPVAPVVPGGAASLPSRLSGSFWLVARGGGGWASAPLGGQLGGSQAGLRLAYLVDRERRIAVAARITSPLGAGLREASVGVEWQPTRLPVRLVAEQRVALNAGKGGPAIGVVGGFGPLPIGGGFRLESYAQAGAIHRDRTEGFVDGAAHVAHPIGRIGAVPIDLGAGLWGGAQRGAERLDIGPSLSAALPVAGRSLRLSLDWRERVAGRARPDSGVALTLGADF